MCSARAVVTREHIVIIGAGLMGLTSASALLRADRRITVIDARFGPCAGTSYSNSGMLHPSQARGWSPTGPIPIDTAQRVAALGVRSTTLLVEDFKRLKLEDALARPAGCLQIFTTQAQIDAAFKSACELGILSERTTQFGLPALLFPEDRSANAYQYGCALEADLRARGVEFIYGASELSPQRTAAGFEVAGVKVDQLVICAGLGTPALLAIFGVEMDLIDVPGIAVDFARPNGDLPRRPIMDAASRSALTVFADRVRISGGWSVTEPVSVLARWNAIAPDLMTALGEPLRHWVGHRPISPTGAPVIGATDVPGLWVNAGHGHMGWTLCAGSAERLAQAMAR